MNGRNDNPSVRRAFGVWSAGAAVALLLLAGCGGHDRDNNVSTTTDVPTSISASVGAFISYLQTLTGSTSETSEPRVVSSAVTAPPADDTSEPTKVD